METDTKDVEHKGAWRDAKGSLGVTYTPRPDASPEGELTALANVYRFLLDRRERNDIASADGPEELDKHVK